MSAVLVLDCYLDDFGCPPGFRPPEVWPHHWVRAAHDPLESLPRRADDYSAIVISGSAASVLDELPWSLAIEELVADAHARSVPTLGVCYGHQLIAKRLFGAAARAETPEVGWYDVAVNPSGQADDMLPGPLPDAFRCFLSHYDEVRASGHPDMQVLAASEACAVQAFKVRNAPIFGVQFHAEFAREEALELFDVRVGNTPDVVEDPGAMRARAVDTSAIWQDFYTGFLSRFAPRRA